MKGDFGQAIVDYDASAPAQTEIHLRIVSVRRPIGKGELCPSDRGLQRALNLSPDDPVAYFARGNAHLYIGELVLALADFNSAIQIDPTSGRSTHGRDWFAS